MPLFATEGRPEAGDAPGLRDIEARAGVFDADALLQERLMLAEELAPLDAVVGPGGTGEQQLKSLLASVAVQHRQEAAEAGRKITDSTVDELARSDPRYKRKLEEVGTMRAEWVVLRAKIDAITTRLQWAQALLRYAANEPRG